ncbi:hypothetical protein BJY21_002475 [Kineosphaera limosa]|uniref:Uncharacterized protein n=1 Tax=Kineosphaera limosa NBRC 100340 TaxID=1184609 RepID=K6WQ25_9MICO|nr:hypothetical protein [Kineosphaera limosa]NYE01291.1 hypothetical protein [Kineosphaera limosa]GAB95911.1 hypothetical protein KILIM_029_00210 [Kineosphaera limosa NBRC 100340]
MGEVEEIRYDTRVGARWLVLFLWALVVMMALQVVLSWRNLESLLLTGLNVARPRRPGINDLMTTPR